MSVVGARPQFVKIAPIHKEMKKYGLQHLIVNTGQHFSKNMSSIFLDSLSMSNEIINLNCRATGHAKQTAKYMVALEELFLDISPDFIFIYGDTNTTVSAALTGSKMNIPLGHVEAGLRSYDKSMPEEINRIVSDHLSSLNFAPTQNSFSNLANEGLAVSSILVGDIMIQKLRSMNLDSISNWNNNLILTLHRPSNVDNPERLQFIMNELSKSEIPIIFPAHPRTAKAIKDYKIEYKSDLIDLREPIGHEEILKMIAKSQGLVTDSGGLQKEAFFIKKPILTLRDSTEWTETIEYGLNRLDPQLISLNDFWKVKPAVNIDFESIYGKGNVAKKIIEVVLQRLN